MLTLDETRELTLKQCSYAFHLAPLQVCDAMQLHILQEYVHNQRANNKSRGACSTLEFSRSIYKNLFGTGRRWRAEALGKPCFETDEHHFHARIEKLLGAGNLDHAALASHRGTKGGGDNPTAC